MTIDQTSSQPHEVGCEFYDATTHCARKSHPCHRCQGTIWAGQHYLRTVYVSEGGKFHLEKTHLDPAQCKPKRTP
ncbi:hypothetical protein Dxin01_00828 [Deinococcus xinjiangensis]|uniref:Uncharacterized protein n=1 Tax=Deinococcus xinjiangensis TaxID=457454 RepID=A0ABP9VBL4_9DEIO